MYLITLPHYRKWPTLCSPTERKVADSYPCGSYDQRISKKTGGDDPTPDDNRYMVSLITLRAPVHSHVYVYDSHPPTRRYVLLPGFRAQMLRTPECGTAADQLCDTHLLSNPHYVIA